MASKAIRTGISLPMTINAFAHGPLDFPSHFPECRHVAVAAGAVDFCLEMPFVREVHSGLRPEYIDSFPRYFFLLLLKVQNLLNLGAFRLDGPVTEHALGDAGNAGRSTTLRKIMAKRTVNLTVDVDTVRERYRLTNNPFASVAPQNKVQERNQQQEYDAKCYLPNHARNPVSEFPHSLQP
jgi:hypothetical protein